MKDVEADDEPDAPDQYLNDIFSHHFARTGILKVLAFEVQMQEVEADSVQVAEEEVEFNDLNEAKAGQAAYQALFAGELARLMNSAD